MAKLPDHLQRGLTDSAGQPWEGRSFSDNPWQHDDGSAPEEVLAALTAHRSGDASLAEVLSALSQARVLIPLVAELGEAGEDAQGRKIDKSADLSIVTVQAEDGRGVVPVFLSAAAMRTWDASARPVPIEAQRAAIATLEEGVELLVIDPGSTTELLLRRPAVRALAQGAEYLDPWQNPVVIGVAQSLMEIDPLLVGVDLLAGDDPNRATAADLVLALRVPASASVEACDQSLQNAQTQLAARPELAAVIDAVEVRLELVPDTVSTKKRHWFSRRHHEGRS